MTLEEAASKLDQLIKEIGLDGYLVYIENDCCGCSKMNLVVLSGEEEREIRVDV